MRQPERAADRQDGVADLNGIPFGEAGGNEIGAGNRQNGNVGGRIGPHSQRPQLTTVVETNDNVVELGTMHDMPIGDHDEPVGDAGNDA